MPSTFPLSLMIPAMFRSDPLGFASALVAVGVRISEDNLALTLEVLQHIGRSDETAITVSDGNPKDFTALVKVREHRVAVLDSHANFGGYELEVRVPH